MITHGLVLAAGLGTRLRPLTLTRAKPAMPIGGVPLIRRIITWLAREGVTDLVVNLHYLPDTIAAVVGDGSDLGARVRYSWEQPAVLGSAGGPRHALPIIGAPTFFIVNGDTLTDLALAPLAEAHARSGARVTMALTPNREPDRYGGVLMTGDGRVTGFVPPGQTAAASYHFIGVQAAEASVFAGVKDNEKINLLSARGVYTALVASQPGSIRGYPCDAAFWDIGTPDDYAATDAYFRSAGL
jgi:NDP-sugar pyrophosphorylase family protein